MKKLDRFSEHLAKRDPSTQTRLFFNEVYDEAEQRELYIEQLETQLWETAATHRAMVEHTAQFFRLKRGVFRNIEQLRRERRYAKT